MDIQRINRFRRELMGFASLWIFYFHVGPVLFSESQIILIKNIEWYINSLGYCGVEIFLFLSGTGLVYAVHKQDLRQFYCRRFLRIYPPFWIWFTVSTLVRNDSMSLMDYLGRITFFSNWTQDLLAYKWYVAVILMFYLWFPLYYCVLQKMKYPAVFTAVLIVAEFCLISVGYDYIRSDLFLFLHRIPVFLTGVLAGHYCVEQSESKIMQHGLAKKGWCALVIIFVGVLLCSYYVHRKPEINGLSDNFRSILNVVTAINLCIIWAEIFELLEKRKTARILRTGLKELGTVSLEFYLVHELISLKVKSFELHFLPVDWINQIIVVLMCFIVSFFAAWILQQITSRFLKRMHIKL